MKLAEKGSFAPPPRLPRSAETLSLLIAGWPRVHARAHWLLGDERTVDGADFYLGEDELGHLHLDGEAHVAVGETLVRALIRGGLASRFAWSRAFVTWAVRTPADVEHGAWLFRLRYDRLEGTPDQSLLERITRGRAA